MADNNNTENMNEECGTPIDSNERPSEFQMEENANLTAANGQDMIGDCVKDGQKTNPMEGDNCISGNEFHNETVENRPLACDNQSCEQSPKNTFDNQASSQEEEMASNGEDLCDLPEFTSSVLYRHSTHSHLRREDSVDSLRLDTLPTEIFLHICSFLEAKFVIRTLSHVCKHFHALLKDNTFWKIRIGKRWHKKYPAIPVNDDEFSWQEACIAREEQHRLWSNIDSQMDYFRYDGGIYASVDVVHLMQNGGMLAAGSRDRSLTVLDLNKLDPENPTCQKDATLVSLMDAHKGWIWTMSSLDHVLVSGSWDTFIKFWDLTAEGQEVQRVKCKSAILCTHYEPNFLVAGGYDKNVYHIDPRAATILDIKRYHKQPVLCMAADDKYIITGSEDKTVAIYDRTAGKVCKSFEMQKFPMCMSYGQEQLWVGDRGGQITLVDATDGDFIPVESYDTGHKDKVTGVIHTLGAIFTCSTDKTINVLEPSLNPGIITTLTKQTASVAGIDFQNSVLASANGDISVGIWKPKKET